ncbi:hypothetical protein RhiJN_20173 [Ceratobasidium sp. AG-Ba]|nr:hypothetical protein RhiJN_20173 [Ceratobasidium sp. AG-Ba]
MKSNGLQCWVDTAPTRAAVLVEGEYRMFTTQRKRDQHHVEALSIELGIFEVAYRKHTGPVILHSDSDTALRALEGEKCKLKDVADSATRTRMIIKSNQLQVKMVYVSSKEKGGSVESWSEHVKAQRDTTPGSDPK